MALTPDWRERGGGYEDFQFSCYYSYCIPFWTSFQINQITQWLDASNIYGSSEEEARLLRTFDKGQLKVTGPESSSSSLLPTCFENFNGHQEGPEACDNCPECFFAGKSAAAVLTRESCPLHIARGRFELYF